MAEKSIFGGTWFHCVRGVTSVQRTLDSVCFLLFHQTRKTLYTTACCAYGRLEGRYYELYISFIISFFLSISVLFSFSFLTLSVCLLLFFSIHSILLLLSFSLFVITLWGYRWRSIFSFFSSSSLSPTSLRCPLSAPLIHSVGYRGCCQWCW